MFDWVFDLIAKPKVINEHDCFNESLVGCPWAWFAICIAVNGGTLTLQYERAGEKFAPAKLLPNSPLSDLGAILRTHSEDCCCHRKSPKYSDLFLHIHTHVCESECVCEVCLGAWVSDGCGRW